MSKRNLLEKNIELKRFLVFSSESVQKKRALDYGVTSFIVLKIGIKRKPDRLIM